MTDETKALLDRISQLEHRLYGAGKMAPRANAYDPTAKMTLPASAVAQMVDAVDPATLRAVSADARRPSPVASRGPDSRASHTPSQNGWSEARPLTTPPGVALLDRLMDHEDAKDKADAIRRAANRRGA
jgi:hypothetical protein